MRYETKIHSTQFNAIAENNILCGKVFFKITENKVMGFYFNSKFKDARFSIFIGGTKPLRIIETVLRIV